MYTFIQIIVVVESLILGYFVYRAIKPQKYDGQFIIKRLSEDEAFTILKINDCIPDDLFKKKELRLEVVVKK